MSYIQKCLEPTYLDCVWCDLKFISISEIKNHVLEIHPFNCNSCVKTIENWDKFLMHADHCKESKVNVNYFISSCAGQLPTSAPAVNP